jgi:hypothetical protein
MIRTAHVQITGISPLLQNNPQVVDSFNHYAKKKKTITNKRTKTEDDLLYLRDVEVESKIFFDDQLGVYVPGSWLMASVCSAAYSVSKISKKKIRGGLFITENKIALNYEGKQKVKTITDIVKNDDFVHAMILPQKDVRLQKYFPIFHKWDFETDLEFDDTVIDFDSLKKVIVYAAKYSGFGDFRPTFGRATAEVMS